MIFRRAPFVLALWCCTVACIPAAWAEGGYAPERYGTYNSRTTNAYQAPRSAASETYLETRISDLENQLRAVYGKLEQAEWQNKRLQTQLDKVQGDMEMRLQTLEQRPARARVDEYEDDAGLPRSTRPRSGRPPDDSDPINRQPSFDGEDADPSKPVTGRLGSLRVTGDRVTGADDDEIKPLLPKTPPAYGLTAQEQYDRAFSLLRNNEYEDAETAFKTFLKKNPKDKLADNAKYWLGETHYVRKQYDAAAVTFADAYQSAPKGAKAPDSLMKLGLSLAGMKKTEDACTTLGEVLNRYPNASAAVRKRTQQEQTRLKCPS